MKDLTFWQWVALVGFLIISFAMGTLIADEIKARFTRGGRLLIAAILMTLVIVFIYIGISLGY